MIVRPSGDSYDGLLLLDPFSRKMTDTRPIMTKLLGYTREGFLENQLWQRGLPNDEQSTQGTF